MKVAIIGSRKLNIDLEEYLPLGITEIISGGAKGIDTCAEEYAIKNNIPIKKFLPEYNRYSKGAPIKRNIQIIDYADRIFAFWDGTSHGTKYVIDKCKKCGKDITVIKLN